MDSLTELEVLRTEILTAPSPALHSLLVIALTLIVIALACHIWPGGQLHHELMWTVAPRDAERYRIQRLILPTEALDFGESTLPTSTPSSVMQRVVQSTTANLVRSSARSSALNPHRWRFRSNSPAARDCTPLLVFVNRGSGGRQGQATMMQLRSLLSPHQVVDLAQAHSAEDALQSFRTVGRFRILVCGGDGTVGWVLKLLDSASLEYTPPVAIMPLGTGNDLARALGWGGGRQPGRGMVSVLEEVDQAQVTLLDRWRIGIVDARTPRQLGQLASSRTPAPREVIMQNYLGIGVDARVALEWHRRRQSSPQLFRSRLRNKVQYARYGVRHLFRSDYADLCSQLVIEADGQVLELPAGTEGIIVLNIASYGGGSDLWGIDSEMPAGDQFGDWVAHCQQLLNVVEDADPPQSACHSATERATAREGAGRQRSLEATFQPSAISHVSSTETISGLLADEADKAVAADAGVLPNCDHSAHAPAGMPNKSSVTSMGSLGSATSNATSGSRSHSRSGSHGSQLGSRLPRTAEFVSPSMDDGLLEVVAVQGVLQLGLAQMSLSGARRLCQCSSFSISSRVQLPVQIDGEPFELEPMFAPRSSMRIHVQHRDQAVMLCRSRVRTDSVALEALDWAMQEGVISVEQRNCVLREVARRTGTLQRRQSIVSSGSTGSFQSLEALFSK